MGFIKSFEVQQSSKIRLTKTGKNVEKRNCIVRRFLFIIIVS